MAEGAPSPVARAIEDHTTSADGPSRYRPHLDGIRAVAVYLVIAFHAGVDRLSGGFVGVDVFFVLSGYLVTQLLLRDLHGGGSIQYRRFYARRMRRLLPAAAVVLIATAVVFPVVAAPAELLDVTGAMRAASLYFANWFFIGQASDYFAGDLQASPVVHFWSLSVEEQFYLAWPLLLGGIYAIARRSREQTWRVVRLVVAVGLVVSLGNALRLAGTNLNRAYYGTDTRAYQLLAGALLALSPALVVAARSSARARRILPAGALVSLIALMMVATSAVHIGPVARGLTATALTIALIWCLEATARGAAGRVLSLPAVVYLGRISYSVYLWHWLVIVVTVRSLELSPPSTAAVAALVASGLAALSYQLLEVPVRQSSWLDLRRVGVIAVGLAVSALVGLMVTPRLLERDSSAAEAEVAGGTTASGGTPIPEDLDWRGAATDHGDFPRCTAASPQKCTLVRGTGTHILLMGDSNARMYLPTLTRLAEERSLTLSAAVAPGCPWQQGILRRGLGEVDRNVQDLGPPCRAHHAEWYDTIIPALDPDVVVVAHQPWDDPVSVRQIQDAVTGPVDVGTQAFLDVARTRTTETIDGFRDAGRKVVIIEPVPLSTPEADPLKCLSLATFLDECRFVSHLRPTPLESLYREIAERDPRAIFTLDLDRETCPYLPICDPVVNGLIVRWDSAHLTQRFARTLVDPVAAYFDANRILQ